MGRGGREIVTPRLPRSRPGVRQPLGWGQSSARLPGRVQVPDLNAPPTASFEYFPLSGPPRDTSGKLAEAPVRIPGYQGFIPASQNHVYGKQQVASPRSLRELTAANTEDKFQSHREHRTTGRLDITLNEGVGHVPGYAGHVPGHDDNLASVRQPFGRATRPNKLNETMTLHGPDLGLMPKADVPTDYGMSGNLRELGGRAKLTVEPSEPARGVPGYRGYLPGRQHHYGRSFGTTVSELEPVRNLDNKMDSMQLATDPRPSRISGYSDGDRAPQDITIDASRAHIPGYAGFLPGLDSNVGERFGLQTSTNLLQHSASIKPLTGPTTHLAQSAICKSYGSPRPNTCDPPPVFDPASSQYLEPGQRKEGDVPGYTGFHPGQQHMFGRSQGLLTTQLKEKKESIYAGHAAELLSFTEPRVTEQQSLTMLEGTVDPITTLSSRAHIGGYTVRHTAFLSRGQCPMRSVSRCVRS